MRTRVTWPPQGPQHARPDAACQHLAPLSFLTHLNIFEMQLHTRASFTRALIVTGTSTTKLRPRRWTLPCTVINPVNLSATWSAPSLPQGMQLSSCHLPLPCWPDTEDWCWKLPAFCLPEHTGLPARPAHGQPSPGVSHSPWRSCSFQEWAEMCWWATALLRGDTLTQRNSRNAAWNRVLLSSKRGATSAFPF